VREE
jgi:hypothetical protein